MESKVQNTHYRKHFYGAQVPLHLQHKKEDVFDEKSCDNCMVATDCSSCIQKAPENLKLKYSKVGV